MPSKLPIHEWCIILLFCMILLLLAGFAIAGRKYVPAPAVAAIAPKNETIQVKIEGEVANPGTYQLSSKTTLKEFIEQAQPLPTADLSQLNWRRKLRDGQMIRIPERRWITIQVAGAVQNPGSLKILSGTRMHEIADQLEPLPEADLKSIQKRKSYIKEGDIIEIPQKKVKSKPVKKPSHKKTPCKN